MIDDHVHPFPLHYVPFEPAQITLDLTGSPADERRRRILAPGRLHLHLMQVELARLLGTAVDEVVAAREEQARTDWTAWLHRLFTDAAVTGIILDDAVGPGVTSAAPEEYADAAGVAAWRMTRIDPLVDQLVGDGASAKEILEAVERFMAQAAVDGCVAYKTVLAYRTGLAVDPNADLESAQRSLAEDAPVRRRGKALRDLVLRTALGRAADLGRPFQVHTGFGDSEIRLAEANPLLLEDLLRSPEGSAAQVVLIHGSFPWSEQAAYLAASKPNVWVELSLSNLFAPVGSADRLLRLLDVAPAGRILLGSDGHGVPETHWFGCRVLTDAWSTVAGRLRDAGAQPGWLERTREAIFEDNARELYRLS